MRLSEIGELSLVEIIRKRFSKKSRDISVGIGDDTAVIKPPPKNQLLTTDMMVEGIHFRLNFTTLYQLGFKLVSVNASDIYAMAGIPQYLLLDLAVNGKTEKHFIDRFFDGLYDALKLYGISLIGGDLSSSKTDMVIAASLIGYAEAPVMRSGARPGDRIYVTGNLGDSACGLEILKKAVSPKLSDTGKRLTAESYQLKAGFKKTGLTWSIISPLIKRHLMPQARNPKNFAKYITAMIDLSDGLFIDLARLCAESGVGAKIYQKSIPVSGSMKKSSLILGLDPFMLATSGGEDYELLFTASNDSKLSTLKSNLKITCIGEITKKGMHLINNTGDETLISPSGYQHFKSAIASTAKARRSNRAL